jgi:hypothetical protein
VAGSEALRPHLFQIAIALSATVLAIFGNDINRAVKRLVNKHPFVVRAIVFVLLVAFAYGAATLYLSSLLARGLAWLDDRSLAAVVIVAFVLVGILAEQKGHI